MICPVWIMVKNLGLLLSFSRDDSQESPSDTENFSDSLDPFLVEAISDLPADGFRNVVKDFVNDYLNRATYLNSMDEIMTGIQELDQEEILDGIISCVAENEIRALIRSVLEERHIETVMPQQQQVASFAAEQLFDMFFMEHLMGKMSFQGPRFSGEEHVDMVIDSLMLDILLRQFFSIQQQQQATSENVPLRDFHLKAFTEVALDVILTELNKVMEEDMEDLLEYERNVHV
ncbi:hypothetical protein lerEdw1_007620 [Lerista edwardsae]|nr:hypothetical protein lerEdw1_007620 [Lerista edwardsae]